MDPARFGELNYPRTQEIGAAVAFLGCDGLIVPSARWACENLVLFNDPELEVISSEDVDWLAWGREHRVIE